MGNNENLKKQVASGLLWKFGERIIAQGISFIISTILARILMPELYGTISLVLIFINLANVFITNGLGEALIRNKEADEKDFSTVFYCSLGISVFLYFILFFCAQWIADFYHNQDLVLVLRVLSLQIPLSSVKTVQHAYVSKHLLFKKFFFSTLGGTIISGVIGIIMALNGAGVWALVEQYLVNSVIDMTVLFFTVSWRPRLVFSKSSAKYAFSYGWKLVAAGFINQLYSEARSIIIGKKYTTADLAYYQKGDHFPSLVITNINTSISTVMFPAMASVNDNIDRLRSMTRQSMKLTSYIIFPMMAGLIAVADPMIRMLLTDKWMPCVPFLRLGCLYWVFQPMQTSNYQAIKAVGRSDICLKLEFIKKGIGIVLILITMQINVYALALSNVIMACISMLLNMAPNKKLIGYGFKNQIIDIAPAAILSMIMGIVVWCIEIIPANDAIVLVLQIVVGIVIYVGGSKIFKIDSFDYILGFIRKKGRRT